MALIFKLFLLLPALVGLCLCDVTLKAVPVVIWHGMGDSCCNPLSMGRIKKLIESKVDGIYVKSLMLGQNVLTDMEHGFFGNMNDLVEMACKQIASDPKLALGYNAIGFSQGGQFLRAVAQRCPNPPMRNYISVGGQHQGIFGTPYCETDQQLFCYVMRRMLDLGAYNHAVQHRSVQAQYWHDPLNEENYKTKSIFLADINNERTFNATYKQNILNLKNMLLIKFTRDHMVSPRESSWFEFYAPGTVTVQALNETRLYKEDLIGLRKLNESGRLQFLEIDGDHLQMSNQEFVDHVINKYLK